MHERTPRMRCVGEALGGYRRMAGFSLEQAAQLVSQVQPTTPTELVAIERGEVSPSLHLFCALACVYHVSIDRLTGEWPVPVPSTQETAMPRRGMSGRMRRICALLGGHRRVAGLPLEYVAHTVGLLDPMILAEIEAGSREPTLELLCSLASLYDVSIDFLVGSEAPRRPAPALEPAPPPTSAAQGASASLPPLKITPELFAAVTAYAEAHGRRVGDILLQAITWRIGLSAAQEERYFPEPER